MQFKLIHQFIFFGLLLITSLAQAESSCKKSHDKALSQCKAYVHSVTGDQISIVGEQTRFRIASQEKNKLYSIGKACAKAQQTCKEVCSEELSEVMTAGKDFSQTFELQSNCKEGEVAKHRSILAKKYMSMKRVFEESRQPSSR